MDIDNTLSPDFVAHMHSIMPAAEASALCAALAGTEPSVAVRVNGKRGAAVPDGAQRVPWCTRGFYLSGRPAFTFDVAWRAGLYYVQDASSQFLHHVVSSLVQGPVTYLDLCAAPGGKTTAALDALPTGSAVVANEALPNRASILKENVTRWGSDRCVVTNASAAQLGGLGATFDVVAADVPCSGEGMMRKSGEARQQWTPGLVQQCAALQRSIIADVWPALKPGGLLIYSTCTFNLDENEHNVQHIIDEFGAENIPVPAIGQSWGIAPSLVPGLHCYRFMPHRTHGEGLFLAVLRKPAGEAARPARSGKGKRAPAPTLPPQAKAAAAWIGNAASYAITSPDDATLVATPRDMLPLLAAIRGSKARVLLAGVTVGTIKGKNVVPSLHLALSPLLAKGAFPTCEVDYLTAIAAMRGEPVAIDAPRGHVLLTHGGCPVGWVNNLGNRANNLYPKSWRILSSHTPEQEPHVL